jgi:endonuclease YncB( thermonuclease family)
MRRPVPFPPFLLVLLLLVVFGTGMRCILGSVSHVVDGDTFDVVANTAVGWGEDCAVAPGQQYCVRLIGVDTPEVYG